jgi:DNA polymerase-1
VSKYLVFDLETENNHSYKRFASPFDQKNWVVARGWKKQGDGHCSWSYHPANDRSTYLDIDDEVSLLVGFNIKFDLLWEMAQGNPTLTKFFKRGGKIWDGQYAEYLLRGQTKDSHMVSMDQIIENYGGRLKIDEVKLLWEQGTLTSQIQEQLLIDYLVGSEDEGRNSGDIGNTELIFLGQIKQAQAQGQIKMLQDRMDGLLSTTDMEFRGLKVNVQEAGKRLKVLQADLASAEQELSSYVPEIPFEFNWGSLHHKSAIIFGGAVKYQLRVGYDDPETGLPARYKAYRQEFVQADGSTHPENLGVQYRSGNRQGEYKTKKVEIPGELKIKWQDFLWEFPRQTEPQDSWKGALKDGHDNPIYSTNSEVVEELSLRNIPFLKAMARKQSLDKEIGTYYVKFDPKTGEASGMLTCVQKHDHIIHHKLNHVNTVTSRLSSNDPNLQNLPRGDKSEVKKMFVSRFGAEGIMLEADYSQLEVVVQGVLSHDAALCKDLNDKIDFHCKRVAAKRNVTYEYALDWCKNEKHPDYAEGKKERTLCKVFSFQRAYGAGAAKIAYETDMDIDVVKALIAAEEVMYPGVVKFNADVESSVFKTASPFNALSSDGVTWKTYRKGYYIAPTGTRYVFTSKDAMDWQLKRGIRDSFMPTELKNYPVQGTGGEFVQAVLGLLWRHFVSTDFYGGKAYLVNTVHDCVWIDCHASVVDDVAKAIKQIMESIPEFYNARYGMNISVPFPVEVEVGMNMHELKHWHPANENTQEQAIAA